MTINPLIEIADAVHLFIPPPDRIAGWRRSGNVVILNTNKSLFLIDSGGPSARKQIKSVVRSSLVDGSRDIHSIHTHGHIDHMAGAFLLRESFGASIWASEEAVPFVMKQSPIFLEREQDSLVVSFSELFTAPSWFVRGAMWATLGRNRPLNEVKPISSCGDLDETGFRPVALPGHHFGHTGFYSDEQGILIAGDLIDPRHRMKPILTSPSSDFKELRDALHTARRLAPSTILPGHGFPIQGDDEIQQSIEKAEEIMDGAFQAVIKVLEEAPSTLPEISNRMVRKGIGPGDVFRRMFIHSILRYLMEAGKVSRQTKTRRKTVFSLQ
ncbi:MAG: MBL fold metallo-hydrolase [Candidatus Thorarchaeota archaeon]